MEKELLSKHMKLAAAVALLLWLTFFTINAFAQKPVKNIVLVHGAFADGSGWEAVYNILKSKGFNVSVVGNPNTGMNEDVAATALVLKRQKGPVLLVGHSYGGAIITEAGNDPNVVGLVYIAAFAPDKGETLLKLLQMGPPNPDSGIMGPENGYIWYDKEKFHKGFCADLPKTKSDFLADSQIPVSAAVFGYEIKEAAWRKKPSWYIVATEDQTIPPDAERFMAQRAGAKVTEIKGSHLVFMSKPEAVSRIIESAAASNFGK